MIGSWYETTVKRTVVKTTPERNRHTTERALHRICGIAAPDASYRQGFKVGKPHSCQAAQGGQRQCSSRCDVYERTAPQAGGRLEIGWASTITPIQKTERPEVSRGSALVSQQYPHESA